jgi:hypothetical protein
MSAVAANQRAHRYRPLLISLVISIVCGTGWFLLMYGRYPLYFTHVDWIYAAGGDVFQHQLGWEWFRQEPWHFPIGRIESYGVPFGTTVSFMDAIPLMAIPLKLLSPLLGQRFQYLGLWEWISVVGQMFAAMLILQEFRASTFQRILGASLLVLSPPMIMRAFGHNSLTAQWILLLGIWFILREYRGALWRGAWAALFAVAVMVHLYFVAMLAPLWIISLYFRIKREKNGRSSIVDIFVVPLTVLVVGYCIGIFSLGVNELQAVGFGICSWNLNGFFNPDQFSAIFKALPMGNPSQWEGYSYLGLGNMLIAFISLVICLQKGITRRQRDLLLPFGIVSFLMCLYALSNKAYVNSQMLWNVSLPTDLLRLASMFQASGRFIWPVFYFIVLFGIIGLLRNFRSPAPLLVLALMLQFIDIQPLFTSKAFSGFIEYQTPLESDFWQAAAKTNRQIEIIPAIANESNYEPIALYAEQNHFTLNWGYFARAPYKDIEALSEGAWDGLLNGHTDDQTLYLIWDPAWVESLPRLSGKMYVCQVDGYNIVLAKDNRLVNTDFDLNRYCSPPSE